MTWSCVKIIGIINRHEAHPSLTAGENKQWEQGYRNFLETFLPLFQSSVIPILLQSPPQQLVLFEHILPQLYSGRCLQLLNAISNKVLNADLMSEIVLKIDQAQVQHLTSFWHYLMGLYYRSVVRMDIFMGLRYLALLPNASAHQ